MERKQTHFKMYKIGRRWAFACAIILALGGATVTARADDNASSGSETASVSSAMSQSHSDDSAVSSSSSKPKADALTSQTPVTSAKTVDETPTSGTEKSDSTDSNKDVEANQTNPTNDQQNTETKDRNTIDQDDKQVNKDATKDDSKSTDTQKQHPVAASLDLSRTKADTQSTGKTVQQAPTTQNVKAVNPDVQDGGKVEDDYADLHNILGVSSQFHIFARDAALNAHTNGNIAVETLHGNVNFGTNIIEELLDKDISYIQNLSKIANSSFVSAGNSRTNKVVFGENINIDISNPNRPMINGEYIDHLLASEVYQDKNGNVYIDFDKEFEKLEKLSGSMSNQKPHVNYTNSDFSDMNNRVIDVSDLEPDENGHIIVNLSADVLNGNTPLTIRGLSADKDGHTVIINVDTEGNHDYHVNSQIKIIYDDGSIRDNKETEDFGDNHLLWNFYDSTASDQLATGKITVERAFQGSILAPKAEIDAQSNIDGNIIANKVVVNAETHRWDLQDNKDNEKDPDPEEPLEIEDPDPEEPGDVEEPEEPTEPEEPGDVEEPEEPTAPEEPGDVEEPEEDFEEDIDEGVDPDEVVDEIEEEVEKELDNNEVTDETADELETAFEEIEKEPANEQAADEETLLNLIDRAIKQAQARHDTALVAKLEGLRTRVAAALAKGHGLPQTDERQNQWISLVGVAMASSLVMAAFALRRKRNA